MTAGTKENLEKTHRAIEWLAKAYWNVPKEEFLKSFNHSDFDIYGEAVSEGLTLTRSAIDTLSEKVLQSIAVDFTALFAGCRPGAPYPYESVFLGEGRLVMQGVRDSVLDCYEEGGYAVVQGEGHEPEDHISHELGYVASLYGRAATARAQGDEDAVGDLLVRACDFNARHLSNWIPIFCREIENASETPFFKGLARLTRGVVESIGFGR
ncbi:MAG: molecular chaperone [Coriobacteriia bacterium]